jgi:hypothetical protein
MMEMPLETMIVLRVKQELNEQLQQIALQSGVSKSALARNTLALCLMPPRKPNQVERILVKIQKEAEDELYGRNKQNHE